MENQQAAFPPLEIATRFPHSNSPGGPDHSLFFQSEFLCRTLIGFKTTASSSVTSLGEATRPGVLIVANQTSQVPERTLTLFDSFADTESMSIPIAVAANQLISLVYVSAGVRVFGQAEIKELLAQSHRNNGRCGITGMLLYRDGNFLQVLEGPDAAVQLTLERIQADPRHRGIVVLRKENIDNRNFSEWTMAFKRVDSAEMQETEGYSPFMELSFDSQAFKERPDFAYRMLLKFKNTMR